MGTFYFPASLVWFVFPHKNNIIQNCAAPYNCTRRWGVTVRQRMLIIGKGELLSTNRCKATLILWYLALVSKSSLWHHDGTAPVCCLCTELALNCSVPLFSSTPLLTLPVWKHCCEYNSASKRKYSCGLTVNCLCPSPLCVCVCVCVCEGRTERVFVLACKGF